MESGGNQSLGVDSNCHIQESNRSRDVCGFGSTSAAMKFASTIVSKLNAPMHPEYANYTVRFASFESWPKIMPQTPESLANAGFYYTGMGDQTLCYHCGGGLKDWEIDDDPWEQHARWFSKCHYLHSVKGRDYVYSVIEPQLTSTTEVMFLIVIISALVNEPPPPQNNLFHFYYSNF